MVVRDGSAFYPARPPHSCGRYITLAYIMKYRLKDGEIIADPATDDFQKAVDAGKAARQKKIPDILEVTVEDELGRYVWDVAANGSVTKRS